MNIARWLLMLVLLCAAVAMAQTDLRTATVEGVVRNAKSAEALADVRITLTPEVTPSGTTPAATAAKNATTDADGKFSITALPPGRYLVNATRTLFFRAQKAPGPLALTLAEGQRLSGVQILLSPTAVIAGRVIDDKREAQRSVRVEALRREFREGLWIWVMAAQNTSDDRGEYRLFNLPPGTYYVRARQNAVPLFYPGVLDSQSAVPVTVDAGAEAPSIDIQVRRNAEYSLQLKLGGVLPGSTANFSIRRKNGLANEQEAVRADTLAENTYRLNLVSPGAYDLFVQVFTVVGTQPRVLTHAASIAVNVTDANQDLGTVAVPSTVPVTGRIVSPEPLPSPLTRDRLVLTMRALDLAAPIAAIARGNSTPPGFNDDGTFTLPNVAPGRYQLLLSGLPADSYLISAREGAREVLDTGLTVTGNQGPLELVIGGPGSVGSVTGAAVNAVGQPVASVTAVLVPAAPRRSNPSAFRTAMTDQSGIFSMRSVLPGEYRILAWEELEPGIHMDPEFLKNFETRGEIVRVQRGAQSAATVRVIAAQ